MSHCPDCKQEIRIGGPKHDCWERREREEKERLARTACSPLRVAYSREEMESKLREWMVKEFGHPRDYINDPDQRNAWYRDNGLLYHFICDHFPSENVTVDSTTPAP